jgi:archaellum component FlaG (FlaF/FlaG flagellin family)
MLSCRRFPRLQGRALTVAAAALLLAGCGGDGSTTPTTPPTTLPAPRVVFDGNWVIPKNQVQWGSFTTAQPGTLDVTIDYTLVADTIVVWLARGACDPETFLGQQCEYAATSFAGPKPREVSVTGAAPDTYTLIVWNIGPNDERIAFQVVLTATAAASLTPPKPGT